MRKIHFYKARSRLGIINPIIDTKDFNIGVEDAPDAILIADFLSKFNNPQISTFTFSKPEDIDKTKYLDVLASELSEFKDLINETLSSGQTQVVIGGDNSVTSSSLLALLDRVKDPAKVGYIQFDSHGDMNLYKTSPSKNFHGMYLRPFIGSFDVAKINSMINGKLPFINTLFIGDLELDLEEKLYFKDAKLKNITRESVLVNIKEVLKELESFVSQFSYLHVNFDIDVLNINEALATGMPSNKGFILDEILPLLKIFSWHPNLSLDLSEVNPQKDGQDKTIKIAQKVLSTMLL